jgi:hypothetical protein
MVRSFAVLLLLLVTLAMAPAAPRLKEPPRPFHPVALGACWVYDDDGVIETHRVNKVEERDKSTILTIEWSRPDRSEGSLETVEFSARELCRLGLGAIPFKEPFCLLRFPATAGDSWEYSLDLPLSGQASMTVFGPEKVEVPAGKFMAYRVERVLPLEFTPNNSTAWYAPEVGLVKYVYHKDKVQVFQSFTPGK